MDAEGWGETEYSVDTVYAQYSGEISSVDIVRQVKAKAQEKQNAHSEHKEKDGHSRLSECRRPNSIYFHTL